MTRAATIVGLAGALALVGRSGFVSPAPHRHSSGTPVKSYRPTNNTPHQGEREKARRRQQLERQRAKTEGK